MFKKGHIPWNKGKKRPPFSKEWKKRMSKAQKGRTAWNKGKKLSPRSEEVKKKISESEKGKIISIETRIKISKFMKGRHHSPATEFKKGRKALSGKNHPIWNPNREELKKNLRNDPEYKQWVRKVKLRDKQTCWINDEYCKGYNIVHHIFSWREYPKLRYELTNGITLCQAHHKRIHNTRAKEKLFKKLFSYLVNHK